MGRGRDAARKENRAERGVWVGLEGAEAGTSRLASGKGRHPKCENRKQHGKLAWESQDSLPHHAESPGTQRLEVGPGWIG